MIKLRAILNLAAILLLSGCGVVIANHEQRVDSLRPSVELFNRALFWEDTNALSKVVSASVWEEVLEIRSQRQAGEKLISMKVGKLDFSDDAKTAEVTVTVDFLPAMGTVVKRKSHHQKWRYDMMQSAWQIDELTAGTAALPTSGAVRPGLGG